MQRLRCAQWANFALLYMVTRLIMIIAIMLMKHMTSEALAVDDGGARLVVLALRDPHLLEGAQRGQDRTADPHRVFALWWRHNLDLHRGGRKRCEFLRHALTDAREHRGAAREGHIGVQVLANIHVALHDRLECRVMDAASLFADEARLKKHLWATESLTAHSDDVSVGKLVGLLLIRSLRSRLHLSVKVQGDVGQFLLHV